MEETSRVPEEWEERAMMMRAEQQGDSRPQLEEQLDNDRQIQRMMPDVGDITVQQKGVRRGEPVAGPRARDSEDSGSDATLGIPKDDLAASALGTPPPAEPRTIAKTLYDPEGHVGRIRAPTRSQVTVMDEVVGRMRINRGPEPSPMNEHGWNGLERKHFPHKTMPNLDNLAISGPSGRSAQHSEQYP